MKVFVSKIFVRNFKTFEQNRPALRERLDSFIRFRAAEPVSARFNKKDDVYSTQSPLKGFRHVHLITGTCIVTYKTTSDNLFLFSVDDHSASDSAVRFARLLNGMDIADFISYSIQTEAPILSSADLKTIRDTIYEIAAEDSNAIKTAIAGDTDLLMEFLADSIGQTYNSTSEALILSGFGNKAGFVTALKKALSELGVRESAMRYYMRLCS